MARAAERLPAEQGRGSGGQQRIPEPRYLAVGQIVGAHGVRGELKVEILTEDPQRFRGLRRVYVGLQDEEPMPWRLQGFRLHGGRALLMLAGCDDRDKAEALCGCLVQVPLSEAIPLEEGEYYEHQIVGLEVWTASGEFLGQVVDILYTGANDVLVVQSPGPGGREILIPAIKQVMLGVDLDAGRMTVQLLDGLL